jgi:hypothetical protein
MRIYLSVGLRAEDIVEGASPARWRTPDWSLGDDDPKAAALTRSRLFAEWADQTILVMTLPTPLA